MFVATLLAALKTPHTHLGMIDDTLILDVDRYRSALLHLVRLLDAQGAVNGATVTWTLTCIAEGWVDDHLSSVRDGLLELGAVKDQAHLDRLLLLATYQILGCGPGTPGQALVMPEAGAVDSAADALLLHTVVAALQTSDSDQQPLGLRLLVRRYALELGLLTRGVTHPGAAEPVQNVMRTPLGDAVLALPQPWVMTFLLTLELLQSAGPADHWRTPQSALHYMQGQAQFLVATTSSARRTVDPGGNLPWRRVRRLHLLGVCEPVLGPAPIETQHDRGRTAYSYRLSAIGATAIAQVLAEPRSELRELAEFLLTERTQAAVAPLLRRAPSSAPRPAAAHELLPVPLCRPSELPRSEAPPISARDSRPTESAPAKSVSTSRPISGSPMNGEPWRLEGSQATTPATALNEATLAEALMVSAESLGERSRPPSSGPQAEVGTRQEIDLGGLIQRAWAELHVARVHFALQGPTVYAVGERRALLQAWRELLRSAADAALQGQHSPPLVTVELDPSAEAVQIRVHDTGPPLTRGDAVALDLTDSAPVPSSRDSGPARTYADSGKRHPVEGTRRGLWLAQRTLSQQGALLALSTPQLGGTTVCVTLPHPSRPLYTAA